MIDYNLFLRYFYPVVWMCGVYELRWILVPSWCQWIGSLSECLELQNFGDCGVCEPQLIFINLS